MFQTLRYAGIATATYLAASACVSFAGAALVGDTRAITIEHEPASRPRLAEPSGGHTPTRLAIERNPFCPECRPEAEEALEAPRIDPDAPFDGLPRTDLPLDLVATMEAEPPGRSIATLEGPDGTGAVAVGEAVLPQVRLARIEEGVVLLDNAGSLEFLVQGPKPKVQTNRTKTRPRKRSGSKRRRKWQIEGASDAVECSKMNCTVEREFIEELTKNPAVLASQARVRPYSSDGLRGFRLSRVRSGTLPELLGLRSGDVVTEVNGRALRTMDAALAMASRLRTSSHLSVGVTRNRGGERFPLELKIQIVS